MIPNEKFPIDPDSPERIQLDELVSSLNVTIRRVSSGKGSVEEGLMGLLVASSLPIDLKMAIRSHYLRIFERPGFRLSDLEGGGDFFKELNAMVSGGDAMAKHGEGVQHLIDYSRGFIEARLRLVEVSPEVRLRTDLEVLVASSPFRDPKVRHYFRGLLASGSPHCLDHWEVREGFNTYWKGIEEEGALMRKEAKAYWIAKEAKRKEDATLALPQRASPAPEVEPVPAVLPSAEIFEPPAQPNGIERADAVPDRGLKGVEGRNGVAQEEAGKRPMLLLRVNQAIFKKIGTVLSKTSESIRGNFAQGMGKARALADRLKGSPLEQRDEEGMTPLIRAIHRQDSNAIMDLIARGANVNRKSGSGDTPLLVAIFKDDVGIAKRLIDAGAKVDMGSKARLSGKIKSNPLSAAIVRQNEEMVRTLLGAGASTEIATENGLTPLHRAAFSGLVNLIGALLEKGADVNVRDVDKGRTPLMVAIVEGRVAAVKFLIKRGARLDIEGKEKREGQRETALRLAQGKGGEIEHWLGWAREQDWGQYRESGDINRQFLEMMGKPDGRQSGVAEHSELPDEKGDGRLGVQVGDEVELGMEEGHHGQAAPVAAVPAVSQEKSKSPTVPSATGVEETISLDDAEADSRASVEAVPATLQVGDEDIVCVLEPPIEVEAGDIEGVLGLENGLADESPLVIVDLDALRDSAPNEAEKSLKNVGKVTDKEFQAVPESMIDTGKVFGDFKIVAKKVAELSEGDVKSVAREMCNLRRVDGSMVSEQWFRDQEVTDGLLRVELENHRHNFIAPDGNFLSKVGFVLANNFCEGRAKVLNDDESYNFIKKDGEWLVLADGSDPFQASGPDRGHMPERFEMVREFKGGKAEVLRNGKWFEIGLDGRILPRRQNPFSKPADAIKTPENAPALSTLVYGTSGRSATDGDAPRKSGPDLSQKPQAPTRLPAPAEPVAKAPGEIDFMVSPSDEVADSHPKLGAKAPQPLIYGLPPMPNELEAKMKGILNAIVFENAEPDKRSDEFGTALKEYVNLSNANPKVDLGHRVIAMALRKLFLAKKISIDLLRVSHENDLELNPESPEAWAQLSLTLYEAGLLKDAKLCFKEAIVRNPGPRTRQLIEDCLKRIRIRMNSAE